MVLSAKRPKEQAWGRESPLFVGKPQPWRARGRKRTVLQAELSENKGEWTVWRGGGGGGWRVIE